MLPDQPAARHRVIAATFTERVRGVPDWDAPSPVPGWTARGVVGHLVEWFPGFLRGGTGQGWSPGPDPAEDPVGAWVVQADGVQALLDDPERAATPFEHPRVPPQSLARTVDAFYTTDVFLHTWDLARASGQDDRLDARHCADLLAGMTPIEELMRSSGQYGPAVPVPADADPQTRLLGFIGRDPHWRPDR